MENKRLNIFDFTQDSLAAFLVDNGFSKFSASQVFDWLYKKKEVEPEEWSNVSKKCRAFLVENVDFDLPKVIWHAKSTDGTRKFLVQMKDSQTVETVLIPAKNRLTQCISSQVGCAIGCTFCHTGTQGFKRHLTTGEVTGQFLSISIWLSKNVHVDEKITNIVYMGQGEPLHNYENVKNATINFLNDKGFGKFNVAFFTFS